MGHCPMLDEMELCEGEGVGRKDGGQSCFLPDSPLLIDSHPRAGAQLCPASDSVVRRHFVGLEGRVMKKVSMKRWKWVWRINHTQDQRLLPLRLGLQGPATRVRGSADPEMSPVQLPQAQTLLPLPARSTVPWPS